MSLHTNGSSKWEVFNIAISIPLATGSKRMMIEKNFLPLFFICTYSHITLTLHLFQQWMLVFLRSAYCIVSISKESLVWTKFCPCCV